MAITTESLPDGPVGTAYKAALTRSGGKPTVSYAITSGSLPPGLKMSTAGAFTGTPSSIGSFSFSVTASDASTPVKNTATKALSINVTPMRITTTSLPAATVTVSYGATLARSGGKGTVKYSVTSGALPPGINLSAAGTFSGTPTTPGAYYFTVVATDASSPPNSASADLSLRVKASTNVCSFQFNIPVSECQALVQFVIDSPDAFLPGWGTKTNPCTWHGVNCISGHVVTLDVIGQLQTVPSNIGNLTKASRITLWGGQFTSLPDSIGKLASLTTFDIGNNQLTTLPDSIGDLANLTSLSIAGQLTRLPDSFGRLSNLFSLNLPGNRLTSLPESFGQLSRLQYLQLENNQLETFPQSIKSLPNLRDLVLTDNQLTSIPDDIVTMRNLVYLIAYRNRLTYITPNLADMYNLNFLGFGGNQLSGDISSWARPLYLSTIYTGHRVSGLYLGGNGCLNDGGYAGVGAWLTRLDPHWQDGCT